MSEGPAAPQRGWRGLALAKTPLPNRTRYTDTLAPVAVTSYAYDAADRLTTVARAGVVTPYTWSDRGELLSDGAQEYEWDAAGRLVGVTGPEDLAVAYTYDGANNRVGMTVDGVATTYTVDPFSPVESVSENSPLSQVLVEATGAEVTRYLYGLDLVGHSQDGVTVYYGYDAQNLRLHLDGSGEIAAQYRYGPFGEVVGDGPTGYGYGGEQWHGEVGLLYLRARYYRPEIGRFASRDEWGGATDWPSSIHRFAYTGNNPINYLDPSGYSSIPYSKRLDLLHSLGLALRDPRRDSLASFVTLAIFAAGLTDNTKDFMRDTTCVINGYCNYADKCVDAWALPFENKLNITVGNDNTAKAKWYLGQDVFRYQGSWADEYYDWTYNQMYHFWFYVATSYFRCEGRRRPLNPKGPGKSQGIHFGGPTWAYIGNWWHERGLEPKYKEDCTATTCDRNPYYGRSRTRRFGRANPSAQQQHPYLGLNQSDQDYNLSLRGIELGNALYGGTYRPADVGTWIWKNLSQQAVSHGY